MTGDEFRISSLCLYPSGGRHLTLNKLNRSGVSGAMLRQEPSSRAKPAPQIHLPRLVALSTGFVIPPGESRKACRFGRSRASSQWRPAIPRRSRAPARIEVFLGTDGVGFAKPTPELGVDLAGGSQAKMVHLVAP